MTSTVVAPFKQSAVAVQSRASCVTKQHRRDRRWGTAAVTCMSVLRAAEFCLNIDGSADVTYWSGTDRASRFKTKVERSGVEFWWSSPTGIPTQECTVGAKLEACLVRVRGVTVDIRNSVVEGFRLKGSRPRRGMLERFARKICGQPDDDIRFTSFPIGLELDDVLDRQALILRGNVWNKDGEPVIEYTGWNVRQNGRELSDATLVDDNKRLFHRVAAAMLNGSEKAGTPGFVCSPQEEDYSSWRSQMMSTGKVEKLLDDALRIAATLSEGEEPDWLAALAMSQSATQIVMNLESNPPEQDKPMISWTVFGPDFPKDTSAGSLEGGAANSDPSSTDSNYVYCGEVGWIVGCAPTESDSPSVVETSQAKPGTSIVHDLLNPQGTDEFGIPSKELLSRITGSLPEKFQLSAGCQHQRGSGRTQCD